ncbi:MAG: mandelate racemase/muconate lactonizing enzyme family protein, partial [Gammaproteobacteria bacterium]
MTTSIDRICAWPISFALPPGYQVNLGIGKAIKRDAVLIEIRTDDGITGWGEAHAGRAPTVIAELVSSTLAPALAG